MTTVTRMDRKLYEAAAKGNIKGVKDHSFEQPLEALLTPNKNTVLHVFIKNQIESKDVKNSVRDMLCNWKISVRDNTNFVEEILSKCPSLLCQVNVKDETPLHLAARYGHAKIVEVLIERARDSLNQDLESGVEPVKKMLGMVNKDKNTALHEAVSYNHLEVTKHLISADPDFPYCVNNEGKTPIYIAAERNHGMLVKEILQNCISPTYDGPFGRTALHAAIFCDRQEIFGAILYKFQAMNKKADQKGWTPLHLAAYSNREIHTKSLLEYDSQVAYMKDKEGRTALHLAALLFLFFFSSLL